MMIATIDSAMPSLPPLTVAAVGVEPVAPPGRPQPERKERNLRHDAARSFAAARRHAQRPDPTERERGGEQPDAAPIRARQAPPANFYSTPFSPFFAQQIAQEALPDDAAPSRQALQRSHEAYRTAAGDPSTLLGPVTPRQLLI